MFSATVSKMLNVMDSYYANMKNDMGINYNRNLNEEDSKFDEVMNVIKPNTTAQNFKDFINSRMS